MLNRQASILTSIVIASRYIPVWIANLLLVGVIMLVAPSTLSSISLSAVFPLTAFLTIATFGQMLVIMTGGIDLSVPNTMTLAAMITVGISRGSDDRILQAIFVVLAVSALIGLINGLCISIFKLNALIVTLAVGQVVRGITLDYSDSVSNEASVPDAMANWATEQFIGASWTFWVAVVVMVLLTLLLGYSVPGRRFQSVGANPVAARIAGIHVNVHVVFAYLIASMLYGLAGVLAAAFIRSPTLGLGAPYLLAPIAAVVIGGTSLTGGLANAPSTMAAAFFLTLLNQMLRVLNLSTAYQFVAFGIAIIGGMIISGDRIITVVEHLFQGIQPSEKENNPSQVSPNLPLFDESDAGSFD